MERGGNLQYLETVGYLSDRQADRETDRQTARHRQTDRHTDRQTDRQTDVQADIRTDRLHAESVSPYSASKSQLYDKIIHTTDPYTVLT
jgi:hypothetical protein